MTPYDASFQAAGETYGVPPWLLEALARVESSLNPNVQVWESKVGEFSYGLFGMLESTARRLGYTGPAADLKRPEVAIPLAAKYARAIINSQGGLNLQGFYSEWNSGNANLWKTSSQVAAHVATFVNAAATSQASWPAAVAAGGGGLAIAAAIALAFFLFRR